MPIAQLIIPRPRSSGCLALPPQEPEATGPIFRESRVLPTPTPSPEALSPSRPFGPHPAGPVQRAPRLSAVGRLAGLDAGLHQLHVRLHALDTRMVELTRGLRQLREAAGDTRDAVEALQEAQSRAEREHGRLEGESSSRGAGKWDDPGQEEGRWEEGAQKPLERLRVLGATGFLEIWRYGLTGSLE